MSETNTATYDQSYTDYQLKRHWLRKAIRKLYLNNAARKCRGMTVDLGCGVGTLLERLPAGSLGLEINQATVGYCKQRGLNVEHYDPEKDNYRFEFIEPGKYKTLISSHVLEHLVEPEKVLQSILDSCKRLGIDRVIIIVPGIKGYTTDSTHRTFIDENYLRSKHMLPAEGWRVSEVVRFPFNSAFIGKYFTHNELIITYDAA